MDQNVILAPMNLPGPGHSSGSRSNPIRGQVVRTNGHRSQDWIEASYDAAQTVIGNELHWKQADHLDPHSAANYRVRRTLRSRSRYEVIENNPYLKGTILTIANDFVGGGPKPSIMDDKYTDDQRREIRKKFLQWAKASKLRRKLWRSRIAKIVDGETFFRAFINKRLRHQGVKLDFHLFECDRCTTQYLSTPQSTLGKATGNEVDGVRFDQFDIPESYYILKVHPGNTFHGVVDGSWVSADVVIHWFRQDRGWLRGIPELTPSLPLCSVLRRYSLAVLRHAEGAADFTAIIESQGPPSGVNWYADGELLDDDPFSTFPIETGMIANMPWGYTLKQLSAVPLGVQYDEFVGAILREITRPILSPYNLTVGTSKDSNMASSVVDTHMYKSGQKAERIDCEDQVLDPMFELWWFWASRTPGYFSFSVDTEVPDHRWRWDAIGLEHTDPLKVAKSLETLRTNWFMTDQDIQETFFNRSYEDWQDDVLRNDEFRDKIDPAPVTPGEDPEETDDEDGEDDS